MRRGPHDLIILVALLAGGVAAADEGAAPFGSATPPPLVEAVPEPEVPTASALKAVSTPARAEAPAMDRSLYPAGYEQRIREGRWLLGMVGGVVGAAALGALTGLVSTQLGCLDDDLDTKSYCETTAVGYGVFAALVGQPLGTWLTGMLLDGDGNFWATIGGSALGYLVGAGIFALTRSNEVGAGVFIAAPLLLSSFFYELTSNVSAKEVHKSRALQVAMMPSVVPTRGGAVPALALSGRF